MDSTKFVAWWGAILSTTAIIWDVYKYRNAGPKLKLSVGTNMEAEGMPQYKGKLLVMGNVVNVGDRPTTITHFAVQGCWRAWWGHERPVKGQHGLVDSPSPSQPLPFELKPGSVWTGIAVQKPFELWIASGSRVYVYVTHSHGKKPVRERVMIGSAGKTL